MTRRKAPHEKLKPGPKPGFKRSQAPTAIKPAAPAEVPAAVAAAPTESRDALQCHRNMNLMSEAELRRYAEQVGVMKRDAQTLPVDRLKQNCLVVIHGLIEDLST